MTLMKTSIFVFRLNGAEPSHFHCHFVMKVTHRKLVLSDALGCQRLDFLSDFDAPSNPLNVFSTPAVYGIVSCETDCYQKFHFLRTSYST